MTVRRFFKPLLVLVAAYGTAGCVTQLPWELPDPYSSGSAGGSAPYYYGGGGYGYGSQHYRGGYYGDPYYYYRRGGVALPYPAYGYAPYYPGYTCWDTNRDGRCDRRRNGGDDDGHDGDGGGRGDGDAGNGGRPDSDRPLRDVRRLFRDRDQERPATAPGSVPNAAVLRPPASGRAGEAPKVRIPARVQAPVNPPPRAEARRPPEPAASTRRAPRSDDAPRGLRDDATPNRRPLR